ncbi:hypothetical protein NIO33_004065 [Salmonella enterica]|nr:hypothetical protein [Salmonella enterica]
MSERIFYFIIVTSFVPVSDCSHLPSVSQRIEKNDDEGVNSDKISNIVKMEQCCREVNAIKSIDITSCNKRKKEFESLMSLPSICSGLRGNVLTMTLNAVVVLYKLKVGKLYADI